MQSADTPITPLIAGNWKMNRLPSEAQAWLRDLLARLEADADRGSRSELLLCVPFTHLAGMSELAFGTPVGIGAQDVSRHEAGAYTGEVSAPMLADLGVRYVIVGHSERREYHAEDDATVNAKAQRALAHGLTPIVCVGERQAERDAGRAVEVVLGQLAGALEGLEPGSAERLVVAYEPVWAIGTGRTPTQDQIAEVHAFLRDRLRTALPEAAEGIRLLYGGSVKPENAAEIFAIADVDGALVGGASLKAADFTRIIAALDG